MNAKQWAAVALALVALGLTVWAAILLVLMVIHAIGSFITAVVLLILASIAGWGTMALMGSIAWEKVGKLFR